MADLIIQTDPFQDAWIAILKGVLLQTQRMDKLNTYIVFPLQEVHLEDYH